MRKWSHGKTWNNASLWIRPRTFTMKTLVLTMTTWTEAVLCAHGRRNGEQGESCPPGFWNLAFFYKIFNKKGCFLTFDWEKWNFTTFPAPKILLDSLEKSATAPLKKSLPTPMLVHRKDGFVQLYQLCLIFVTTVSGVVCRNFLANNFLSIAEMHIFSMFRKPCHNLS